MNQRDCRLLLFQETSIRSKGGKSELNLSQDPTEINRDKVNNI
jgi:hypothetical protein